jgi:hypothetical protein
MQAFNFKKQLRVLSMCSAARNSHRRAARLISAVDARTAWSRRHKRRI